MKWLQIRFRFLYIVDDDKVSQLWEFLDLDFARVLGAYLGKGFGKHADVGGGSDARDDEEVLYAN